MARDILVVALAIGALSLFVAACGGDDDRGTPAAGAPAGGEGGRAGGSGNAGHAGHAGGAGGAGDAGGAGGAGEPLARYSEVCTTSDDCSEPLECAAGVCTAPCTSSADCNAFSATSVCINRCFEPCGDTGTCQRMDPALKCLLHEATKGTCRVQ